MTMADAKEPRSRRGGRVAAVVLVALVTVAGLALIGIAAAQALAPASAPPPVERVVTTSAAETTRPLPAAAPERLRIPVIGFEADIRPMATPSDGVIYPPGFDEAYWLEEFGLVGSDAAGTAYLAGHSSPEGGRAVFDPLVDRERSEPTLQIGDELVVDTAQGEVVYLVTALRQYGKSHLSDIADLWTDSPGRLVLITCAYPQEGGPSSDNLVVYARLAPQSGG